MFKGRGDKTQSKKYWMNPLNHKVDDRAFESSKRGEETSYLKDKLKKKVCGDITVKSEVTWPRIPGTRKTREQ